MNLHPDCTHDDLIGPFEMDGRVGTTYYRQGCWWTVCRGCGVSELVAMPISARPLLVS